MNVKGSSGWLYEQEEISDAINQIKNSYLYRIALCLDYKEEESRFGMYALFAFLVLIIGTIMNTIFKYVAEFSLKTSYVEYIGMGVEILVLYFLFNNLLKLNNYIDSIIVLSKGNSHGYILGKNTLYKGVKKEIEKNFSYYILIRQITSNFTTFEDLEDLFIDMHGSGEYIFSTNFYINNFPQSVKMIKYFSNSVPENTTSLFSEKNKEVKKLRDEFNSTMAKCGIPDTEVNNTESKE